MDATLQRECPHCDNSVAAAELTSNAGVCAKCKESIGKRRRLCATRDEDAELETNTHEEKHFAADAAAFESGSVAPTTNFNYGDEEFDLIEVVLVRAGVDLQLAKEILRSDEMERAVEKICERRIWPMAATALRRIAQTLEETSINNVAPGAALIRVLTPGHGRPLSEDANRIGCSKNAINLHEIAFRKKFPFLERA